MTCTRKYFIVSRRGTHLKRTSTNSLKNSYPLTLSKSWSLSIYLSIYLSVCLSFCLSVCLSVCLSINLSIIYLSSIYQYIFISSYLYLYSSTYYLCNKSISDSYSSVIFLGPAYVLNILPRTGIAATECLCVSPPQKLWFSIHHSR